MTLTEFLLARIADDEDELSPRNEFNRWAWIECESKRALLALWDGFIQQAPPWAESEVPTVLRLARTTLGILALPYADHPDYREEWRP